LAEEFVTKGIHFPGRMLQGFFYQFCFGGKVSIKATVGEAQRFHEGLQPRRTNPVPSEEPGGFLDDALMGLGFMAL
jgi:hypothetical protein